MKKLIGLLVIAQFICLSQSAQVKRASDACPGANNKSSTSKDYAYLSKRTAGDSDFSKPKYQSIYAKNTSVNTTTRKGKAIAKEERIVSQKSTRLPAGQAGPEKQTAPVAKEEKMSPSKTILSSEPKEEAEDEFIESMPSEKKTETSKPFDIIQTEKAVSSESKPAVKEESTKEEGKTVSSPKESSGTKKSEKATSKNGSTNTTDLTTTKAVKQKQQKKNTAKKLRLGKKCATDCPEF